MRVDWIVTASIVTASNVLYVVIMAGVLVALLRWNRRNRAWFGKL